MASNKNSIGSAPKGSSISGGHFKQNAANPSKMSVTRAGGTTYSAMGKMPKSGK